MYVKGWLISLIKKYGSVFETTVFLLNEYKFKPVLTPHGK